MVQLFIKNIPVFFFWLSSVIIMYWFGWSNDANVMNSESDIAAKLLHLSEHDRKKREASRKSQAKAMIALATIVSVLFIILSIIEQFARN